MEKWYDVYKTLSDLLLKFYMANLEDSGKVLYKKYIDSEKNSKYKQWLARALRASKTNSIDPVHMFSSFNASRQAESDRVKIINSWFKVLDGNKEFNTIDFYGCPTPISIKLLSQRDSESQVEIWYTFQAVKREGQNGITEMMFSNIKKWYGIEVPSFSIFLFWIDARNFLPLDKNSEKLLFEAGIIKSRPRTSYQYAQLLPQVNTTLYLDIARHGYELATSEITKSRRIHIQRFIQRIRVIYNRFKTNIHTGGEFDFKIVALRPLKGSYKKHTKVLQIEKAYYTFYKEYEFRKDGKIRLNREYAINLYNVNGLTINISAIVGKNGSGKSTITELLYLAINNIAAQIVSQDRIELTHEPGLNLDLFYTTGTFCRLRLMGKRISITEYEMKDNILSPKRNRKASGFDLSEFFYTIAVNYSHYGLNSIELGDWINKLFHKNDGYQTPLVINPFRKEGNFDFNNENELVKGRLLANIVQPVDPLDTDNLRILTENGRRAQKIHIREHINKIEKLKEGARKHADRTFEIFLTELKLSTNGVPRKYLDFSKLYIASKLKRICDNYFPYERYLNQNKTEIDLRKLPDLLKKIESDTSHIVYKIKQVINFYRHKTYKWYPLNRNINIDRISRLIEQIKSEHSRDQKIKSIELLPPPFYDHEIILNDGSSFQKLSSGEKQRIYTVSSIIYHLYNLDSVSESNNLTTYPFVNITFDEVELYFHPEMQRKFVNYFLQYLTRTTLDNILALNFCFITHSPFILSDIPSQNILFLNQDSNPNETLNESKTLGGNIHDLLANNFFLDKGYMGEYANKLISSLIAFLSNDNNENEIGDIAFTWSQDSARKIIRCIGEPLIRNSLEDLYLLKFNASEIENQFERYRKLKTQLK